MKGRPATVPRRPVVDTLPLGILTTLAVLGVAELLSRTRIVNPDYLPPMSTIFARLCRMTAGRELWSGLGDTMLAWLIGMAITAAIAIPMGLLIGEYRWLYEVVRTSIEFCRPIPPLALIPLMVLVQGQTVRMQVWMIVLASVWPLLLQILYGVRDVDNVLMQTAASYRLGFLCRARRLVLPATLPYAVTGLRISAAIALIVAVSVEYVTAAPGIGALLRRYQEAGLVVDSYGLIFAVGVLGVLINSGFGWSQARLARNRPTTVRP